MFLTVIGALTNLQMMMMMMMMMKVVTFESLGTVSYSPSIVTTMAVSVAVCEIFSVKEWRDLENQVWGRSRSVKMAPFDIDHMRLSIGRPL